MGEENIINVGKKYALKNRKPYFDLKELKEKKFEKEVFIDEDGFDGNSSLNFFDG